MSWSGFFPRFPHFGPRVLGVSDGAHQVCFYDRDEQITALVTRFALEGLHKGQLVVVVATTAHLAAVEAGLVGEGVDPASYRAAGTLATFDAALELDSLVQDPGAFIGGFAESLRASRPPAGIRVYGEMVALLWGRGDIARALQVETLWDDAVRRDGLESLCAYPSDVLAGARLADVRQVCSLHSELSQPWEYPSPSPRPMGPQDHLVSEVFLPLPGAVAAARRFVAEALGPSVPERVSWDAALIMSELATNAINHTAGPFQATVTRSGDGVRVAVEDAGPGVPTRGPGTDSGTGGRGMAIVEELSHRWGWEPRPGGKVVWVELGGIPVATHD